MTRPSLRIRSAKLSDAYALWVWANDPDTRLASHDRPVIDWPAHVSWLRSQLDSSDSFVLMAEDADDCPIGSVRFDTADAWKTTRLSYVMAPEARGRGLSIVMVADAVAWLAAQKMETVVVAEVVSNNEKSLRVFRRLQWRQLTNADEAIQRFATSVTGA